jgi:hypothetical protein
MRTTTLAWLAVGLGGLALVRPAAAEEARSGPPRININEASYGANCKSPQGTDVTSHLKRACDGKAICHYRFDLGVLGDPAPRCNKEYSVNWSCGPGWPSDQRTFVAKVSQGGQVEITCLPYDKWANPKDVPPLPMVPAMVVVLVATYGKNCGAEPGNDTERLKKACGNQPLCTYVVDGKAIGDPMPGCPKDYLALYRCPRDGKTRKAGAKGEAGHGSKIVLDCR